MNNSEEFKKHNKFITESKKLKEYVIQNRIPKKNDIKLYCELCDICVSYRYFNFHIKNSHSKYTNYY